MNLRAARIMRHRQAVTLGLLTMVCVAILVSITMMFVGLERRERDIAQGIREDTAWATFQADREAGRFIEAIYDAEERRDQASLDNLLLRFDVLYSRAPYLAVGDFALRIGGDDDLRLQAKQVHDLIIETAPEVDALVADPSNFAAGLPNLLERAGAIREATGNLSQRTNRISNETRVASRVEVLKTYRAIAFSIVVLTGAMGLIVALLIYQIWQATKHKARLRLLSQQNAAAAEAAHEASRAKSRFLATMSHEIRTPLNGIIGMTEILRSTSLAPRQARSVEVIRQSGNLLLDVINDILDFSRLEAGSIDLVRSRFHLCEVVEPVFNVIAHRSKEKSIEISCDAPEIDLEGDPARLRQILVNLAGNAVKFTNSGSVRIRVSVLDGGTIRFEVTDSGIGISDGDLPKLFNEFTQVDSSSTRRAGGSGLGLAISKRLVEAFGGRIGVSSVLGVGSAFWFEIPNCDPREAPPPVKADPSIPTQQPQFSGHVLVVEDNPVNREVAGALLEQLGLEVSVAVDGREGVEMILRDRYDLVFMDMQMPVLDGVAATTWVRDTGDATVIVGLTANAFESDRLECLAAGMDDFIAKPVTLPKLVDALQTWINARRAKGKAPALPAKEEPPLEPKADATPKAATPAPILADEDAPAAPVDPDEGENVSEDQIAELIGALGEDYVRELVTKFIDSAANQIGDAEAAAERGDASGCDRALHSLKGAALTLGFTRMAKRAQNARLRDGGCPEPAALAGTVAALRSDLEALRSRSLGEAERRIA